MGPMPLRPASRFFQASSVPIPQAQTSPTPVTTTRRFNAEFSPRGTLRSGELLFPLGVLVDIRDGVLHRGDLFRILVGYFDPERFFEGHHEFDDVERIGAQIVHKRSRRRHFAFIHTELFDDNLFHAFFDAGHSVSSSAFGVRLFVYSNMNLPGGFPRHFSPVHSMRPAKSGQPQSRLMYAFAQVLSSGKRFTPRSAGSARHR